MFDVQAEVKSLYQQVVEWRRQIHMHPETAFNEHQTAALVEKVLKDAGVQVQRYPDSTAVVGVLKGGKPGRTIALRADMDALPLEEEVDWPYRSQNPGVMHACGHDVHTAILMGVATILARHRDQLPGTVKFLFQPAEELPPGGAKPMVEAGVLKNPDVEHVFGLHVSTDLPVGEVGVTYGYSSANSDRADITIIGKGGHGAQPDKTVDAVVVACQVITALQTIVSRNISALDSAVISVGSLHAGTVNNIIAETAKMQLTIRSLKEETRELLKRRIEEVVAGVTAAMGASFEMDYSYGYPSLPNDDGAVDLVKRIAERVVGQDHVQVSTSPGMGGEDFAYFAQEVPSAFFRLGARPEDGEVYPGHNPKFRVNEACIKVGLEMMIGIVLEACGKE